MGKEYEVSSEKELQMANTYEKMLNFINQRNSFCKTQIGVLGWWIFKKIVNILCEWVYRYTGPLT